MRKCPHCHAEYPEDVPACLLDRTLLDDGGPAPEVDRLLVAPRQRKGENHLAWIILAFGLLSVPVAFFFALLLGNQTSPRSGSSLGYLIVTGAFFVGLGCSVCSGFFRRRPWYDKVFWGILGGIFFAAVVYLCIVAVIFLGGISIQT
jgi:hypothetical protein